MDNELFSTINDIFKKNEGILTETEPQIVDPEEAIIRCFTDEQKSKGFYQILLILGLLAFLFAQLIFTNNLYDKSIATLLATSNVDRALATNYFELYNNVLEQLGFYTTTILGEFIAIFYFIIRWGFNSTISELFTDFFVKKRKKRKKKEKEMNTQKDA